MYSEDGLAAGNSGKKVLFSPLEFYFSLFQISHQECYLSGLHPHLHSNNSLVVSLFLKHCLKSKPLSQSLPFSGLSEYAHAHTGMCVNVNKQGMLLDLAYLY